MPDSARRYTAKICGVWLLWQLCSGTAVAEEAPLTLSLLPGNPVNAIAVPLIVEIYKRAGITVLPKPIPPLREARMLQEGTLDGVVGMLEGFEANHPDVIPIPVPLETLKVAAFVVDDTPDLATLLGGRRVRFSALRGVDLQLKLPGYVEWVFVNEPSQVMQMLVRGRVDAAITVDIAGLRMAREMPEAPIRALQPALSEKHVYHYLHRNHADLVPRITAVMQTMYDQGYLQALHAQFRRGTEAAVSSTPPQNQLQQQ
tara:strand:- start:1602 stop:2375 length:774 start_codon:yes stop_codon:yes gene_type:complete